MSATISFELITPDGLKFQEEVYEVVLPTPEGRIAVLPRHTPLITLVVPGVLMMKRRSTDTADRVEHVATSGGFAEIDGHRIRLLADTAERADDIDELKAQEALQKAQNLKAENKDQVSLADATRLIELNTARLKVAELKRRKRR